MTFLGLTNSWILNKFLLCLFASFPVASCCFYLLQNTVEGLLCTDHLNSNGFWMYHPQYFYHGSISQKVCSQPFSHWTNTSDWPNNELWKRSKDRWVLLKRIASYFSRCVLQHRCETKAIAHAYQRPNTKWKYVSFWFSLFKNCPKKKKEVCKSNITKLTLTS